MPEQADGVENDDGAGGGGGDESSDSMRTFGAVARALRSHAGYSREEFAELVRFSKHTVASIEGGRRMPDPAFVELAEEATGRTGALRDAAKHIGRKPGLAVWFRRWARMESSAITLYTYENRLLPGLLQTEAYARAVFEAQLPPMDDVQIDVQWEARAERQRLLTERPNTEYSFILEEQLFVRRTGGPNVTRELIDHVLVLAARRNIEVLVVPAVCEHHAGLAGPLQLLETLDNQWYAYCEGQENGMFIPNRKVVGILQQRYGKLRSQALSAPDSVSLLQRLRGEL